MTIDCGDAMDAADIAKYLIDPKPGLPFALDYIVQTHLHSDHMGKGEARLPKSGSATSGSPALRT